MNSEFNFLIVLKITESEE